MDLVWRILGITLALVGASVVYGAKYIVKKYDLARKERIIIQKLDDEVLENLKIQKAVIRIKVIGGLIFLPGMILILIAFR